MQAHDETADWARYDPAACRLTLTVHVQPNARRSGIAGRHGDALKIRIAAPASNNRANDALIAFIAGCLALPRSAVTIRQGSTSRRKVVAIAPVDAGAALRLLSSTR
jgi:uncharacterized protein (TIGR00251 family)